MGGGRTRENAEDHAIARQDSNKTTKAECSHSLEECKSMDKRIFSLLRVIEKSDFAKI
jgi:hypothetical protein